MRDTVIPGYMNSLNTFAIDLSDKVNSINSQGYGLDGSTGNNFFNSAWHQRITLGITALMQFLPRSILQTHLLLIMTSTKIAI